MDEKKKQLLAEDWQRCLKVHKRMSEDLLETRGAESRMQIKHDRNVIEGLMMGYVLGGTDLLIYDEDIDDDFTEWLIDCEKNPFIGNFRHVLEDYYACKEQDQEG